MVCVFRIVVVVWMFALSTGAKSYGDSAPLKGNWGAWQEAKNLYDSQKFQEALMAFQQQPNEGANYYYNLGTTYYRLKRLGEAVGYLEKANRIHPHDPDILHNLNLIRTSLGQSIGSEKLDPASTWIEQLADRISLDEVRGTLGLLGILVALLWTRAYLSTRNLKKLLINPAGLLGLLGFAITAGIYGVQRWAEASPPAIALSKQVIRSGPGDHYLELARIEEGSKVRVLGPSATGNLPQEQELWRQVRFSPEGIGWVRASTLLAI